MNIFPNKCKRCGMRYPARDTTCAHCYGLTDEQLRSVRLKHGFKGGRAASTSRLLVYIAGLVIVGMIIYQLNQI